MIELRTLAGPVEVVALPASASAGGDPAIEARVDALWQAESARRPLVDGRLFSVEELGALQGGVRIRGAFVDYRRWIAQRADSALALGIRPLAVTGLVRTPGGWVFGRRSRHTTQDPGRWEPAPSGGIDGRCEGRDRVDPVAALLHELDEELGVAANEVRSISPRFLAHDTAEDVFDLVYALRCDLAEAELESRYRARCAAARHPEHDELAVVPEAALGGFAARSDLSDLGAALARALRSPR